ncbi:MAG: ABC-2 family transporter protein [candidate division SR1 bacterium]|nr:ABC-2 family transporter protein [candidate division SR1 bacterium]
MNKTLRQYRGVLSIAYKNYTVYIHDLVGINIIYILRLIVIIFFYKAIYTINPGANINGYTLAQVTRALIFVQAVVVAKNRITEEVNLDIKTGKIAIYLLNPINYIWYKFFESFSKSIYNLIISLGIGLGLGYLILGSIPFSLGGVLGGSLLLFGGMIVNFFGYFMIGLLAFYTEDADSFRLLYAKMDMVLGGNILPIPFMPMFLQTIAFASPFAYAGYTAGLIFTKFSMHTFLYYAVMQAFRIIILIGVCHFIYAQAKRKLTINGG